MTNMPEFRPGLSASQAHRLLKNSVRIMNQAHHCAVLWFGEIMHRRLYRELGFSTMRAYAIAELGFSPTRAGDFILLARKLADLPAVKNEMATGKLGYTVAREIASVAVPATEEDWLREARTRSRRELSATVKHARAVAKAARKTNPNQGELLPPPAESAPAASVPIRITFELTPLEYARYEAVIAQAGHHGNKAELLLAMATALASENTPRRAKSTGPHYQIHVHQCPDCGKHTVQTPQGARELSPTDTALASEDAQVHLPGRRNTTTIPPRIRREVLARDRHQCRRKGCNHTRHLHLHHIVSRADGGSNDEANLVSLCAACHRLWHEKGGDLGQMLEEPSLSD